MTAWSLIFVAITILSWGCSSGSQHATNTSTQPVPQAPPADQSRRFPLAGQTRMQLVAEHLLGKSFMPGGNLAEYKNSNGSYRQFVVRMSDAQKAAFLLLDFKNSMRHAKYLAHMGGYFGEDSGEPLYVFAKGPFLAGFIGLPEEKADAEARRFALSLN